MRRKYRIVQVTQADGKKYFIAETMVTGECSEYSFFREELNRWIPINKTTEYMVNAATGKTTYTFSVLSITQEACEAIIKIHKEMTEGEFNKPDDIVASVIIYEEE